MDAAVRRYAVKRDPWTEREIARLSLMLADFRCVAVLEQALAHGPDAGVDEALSFLENRATERLPLDQFRIALNTANRELLSALLTEIRKALGH